MNRIIKKRRTIIMVIAVLALVFATGAYIFVPKGISRMYLMKDSGETIEETLDVYVGTQTQLSCKTVPAIFMSRDISYMTADETIAMIDEAGLLTVLKEGETRLTVECAGTRKNYTIIAKTAVEDITGIDEEIALYEGEEFQLEPKIKMAEKNLKNPEIKYTTKRNTIADVDKNGLITAVKAGETTITVSAGDVTKKVKVTVEEMPADTSAPVVFSTNDNSSRTTERTRGNNRKESGSGGSSGSGSGGGSSGSGSGGGSSDSGSGGSSGSGSGGGSLDGGSGGGSSDGGSGGGSSDSGSGGGSSDSGSSDSGSGGGSSDSGSGGGSSDSGSGDGSSDSGSGESGE